jgi:hypothetical protein
MRPGWSLCPIDMSTAVFARRHFLRMFPALMAWLGLGKSYMVRGYQIPPGTCDAAKRRAHEELARASGGRSREELVQIVTQAREQVYAPLLKAQDDARAAEARAVAEREARLAQEREEAQRREQATISAIPQGLEPSAPGADRFADERELTGEKGA